MENLFQFSEILAACIVFLLFWAIIGRLISHPRRTTAAKAYRIERHLRWARKHKTYLVSSTEPLTYLYPKHVQELAITCNEQEFNLLLKKIYYQFGLKYRAGSIHPGAYA